MGEIARILELLDRTWKGPAWHGPAVLEVLDGIDAAHAAARPLGAAHSIWELAEHIAVWEGVVARRLTGETVSLTDAEDWPPVLDHGEAAWERTRERLGHAHEVLRVTVAAFPEARLDEKRAGAETTWYVLIHGAIHHDLYHAGQIALLKKGLG